MNLGKIDPTPERHEAPLGNLVLLEKPAADLQVKCPWQLDRTGVPLAKALMEFTQPNGVDGGWDLRHPIRLIRIK